MVNLHLFLSGPRTSLAPTNGFDLALAHHLLLILLSSKDASFIIPIFGIMKPMLCHVGIQEWSLHMIGTIGQAKMQYTTIKQEDIAQFEGWTYHIMLPTIFIRRRRMLGTKLQGMRSVDKGGLTDLGMGGCPGRKGVDIMRG
eukprot:CAMPEP_0172451120 /NCGR_PEP_ID=MMETSP1065-20121228/9273_1 /TAXON_ID=265537 /ORGANISM="Amphiprora paludosa, Strain CCMP125" /LENGTH=141 /DNA_ID=CAMNT_0013203027 /DNA_START=195 /DNA_END=620 /DNA_ORIENTATION=+